MSRGNQFLMDALKRRELKAKETELLVEKTAQLLGGAKDLTIQLAKLPVLQVIFGCVLIESLQRVYVNQDYWNKDTQTWEKKASPLISQALATTMEGVVVTTSTLSALGGVAGPGGLGGLIGSIGGLIK